jgi:hypothetical protein
MTGPPLLPWYHKPVLTLMPGRSGLTKASDGPITPRVIVAFRTSSYVAAWVCGQFHLTHTGSPSLF